MKYKDFEPSIIQEKRILKLCKRLNKFSLDEIETISEIDSTSKLPLFFEFHKKQDIEYIIRGFCTDIEVLKMIDLFGFSKHVMNRESVYEY